MAKRKNSKETFIGKEIVEVTGFVKDSAEARINLIDGQELVFYVPQDCCNDGWLYETIGLDPEDLIGAKLLDIERMYSDYTEADNDETIKELNQGSHTWSFIDIKTSAGCMTLRWFGTSSGYYSESCEVNLIITGDPLYASRAVLGADGKLLYKYRAPNLSTLDAEREAEENETTRLILKMREFAKIKIDL